MWEGRLEEALQLARRSYAIQRGHGEGVLWPDQLLLARIHAARGEIGELAAMLAELRDATLGDTEQAIVHMLEQFAGATSIADWLAALSRTDALLGDQLPSVNLRLELAWVARKVVPAKMLDEIRALASRNPIWCRRVSEF